VDDAVDVGSLPREASWEGVAVTGELVGGTLAEVDLDSCTFERCRLTGSVLERMHLSDVVFLDCDLSGVVLDEVRLHRVEFRQCRMTGVVTAGAKVMEDVRFTGCKLDEANFRMIAAKRLSFTECSLRRADLYAATVESLVLEGCDLTELDLSKADIPGARLAGSTLIDVLGAEQLRGAVIDAGQAVALGLLLLASHGIVVEED
jgi:uncharacterized protein YjbI with pentapeptide repeats